VHTTHDHFTELNACADSPRIKARRSRTWRQQAQNSLDGMFFERQALESINPIKARPWMAVGKLFSRKLGLSPASDGHI